MGSLFGDCVTLELIRQPFHNIHFFLGGEMGILREREREELGRGGGNTNKDVIASYLELAPSSRNHS